MSLENEIANLSPTHHSYYSLLGLTQEATQSEIKTAYRKRILQLHPDKVQQQQQQQQQKHHQLDQSSNEKSTSFQLVSSTATKSIDTLQKAYKILNDFKLRSLYDAKLNDTKTFTNLETVSNNLSQGLESISLDDFHYEEDPGKDHGAREGEQQTIEEGSSTWWLDCPRCLAHKGFTITEDQLCDAVEEQELEDGVFVDKGDECSLLIQCLFCTLWITVTFRDDGEDEDEET
ncbi:unnamed protein product [Ambrosiozyma monospora]|uniref:Unnamed protein product n=1 Tax=Ambrosiozyma monospora TaxID=43982 RepID=A0ACB5T2C0_AMBMO|nr:unnamed protein product [Ambrosiozyma monospora]